MKAMYRAALMVAAFVFLFPLSARSEIKEGSIELGLFGGHHFFDGGHNLKDRPVYGGRIAYNFTKYFSLEGSMEVVKTRVDDAARTDGAKGRFLSPTNAVRIKLYHIDAVYHLKTDGNFTPYIVGGYGLVSYSPSISTKAMSAINFGVGTKYWMSDSVALRFDLRDNMVTSGTFHNVVATVGISFALGGNAKPAPQPVAVVKPAPEPAPVAKPVPVSEPAPVAIPAPEPEAPVVVIVMSEPEIEEKVIAIKSEPKIIEEKIIVLAFEDINFEFDSSALTKEAQTILKRNIQLLRENPKAQVRIAGYTSASGTDEYNQKLSERRANSVREYLNNEGLIAADRLTVIGYGEDNPETYEVAPKDLYSNAAMSNMRVLFEIVVR